MRPQKSIQARLVMEVPLEIMKAPLFYYIMEKLVGIQITQQNSKLWQGLCLANQHNYQPIIIEGDSEILINMAIQIQQGTLATKVANSWRLAARLELIEQGLKMRRAINFNHIKRERNKTADILANIGVDHNQTLR